MFVERPVLLCVNVVKIASKRLRLRVRVRVRVRGRGRVRIRIRVRVRVRVRWGPLPNGRIMQKIKSCVSKRKNIVHSNFTR